MEVLGQVILPVGVQEIDPKKGLLVSLKCKHPQAIWLTRLPELQRPCLYAESLAVHIQGYVPHKLSWAVFILRLAEFFYDVKKKQSPALVPLASKGQKT